MSVGGVLVMKNTNRALRRHHQARILNRAIRKIKNWEPDPDHLMWRARRVCNNMKSCSCDMCCNERQNPWYSLRERLTFAERRNIDSFNDQMLEVDFLGYMEYNPYLWLDEKK